MSQKPNTRKTSEAPTDPLAGVEFIDEPSSAPTPAVQNQRNQEAAKKFIAEAKALNKTQGPTARPVIPPLPASRAEELRPKLYLVQRDRTIKQGASEYTLRAGKQISSAQYDVEKLKRLGVELSDVSSG